MARTYSAATDAGRVRLLIADTSGENSIFSDAEISDALTEEGSVEGAAARLLRVLAAAALRAGDSGVAAGYLAMADVIGPDSTRPDLTVGSFAPIPSEGGHEDPT